MTNQEPSDTELMARLARGEVSALGQLARRHQRRVPELAFRTLGDWGRAEDVALPDRREPWPRRTAKAGKGRGAAGGGNSGCMAGAGPCGMRSSPLLRPRHKPHSETADATVPAFAGTKENSLVVGIQTSYEQLAVTFLLF
jgi:hypothetical protein